MIEVKKYRHEDATEATRIWNRVVDDAKAFPQTDGMTPEEGDCFFSEQSYTGIAWDSETGDIVGLYILHPNNIGRCGHICNASYAVDAERRGQHIGETLVRDCMKKGAELGFRILQFNAVVRSNTAAIKLYEKLGFVCLGTVPGGFLNGNGEYEDINLYYRTL